MCDDGGKSEGGEANAEIRIQMHMSPISKLACIQVRVCASNNRVVELKR